VKNPFTGFICTCLLVLAGNLPGRAQEKKPDPQPVDQSAPASTPATDAAQPAAAAPSDTAADQQTPPAGQTPPTGQTPVPPPTEDQPTQHSIIPQPPPPPPKVPDVRRPGESGFWIGIQGWIPKEQPYQNGGNLIVPTSTSNFITLQGRPKAAESVEAGMAVGLHNTLKFIYTDFHASGDYTTPIEVTAWSQTYSGGTYVSTNYHVQTAKLSYEYLTWPYPVGSRKIRLKTLWQVQFTNVSTTFDAPLNYYDSNGNLILDSSGNPINLVGAGTKRIISPEFGLGFSYYPSRHVRIEAGGSGFGFPHRYYVWDGDIAINYRVLNHFEIGIGGRGMGFKTSTHADYFIKGKDLGAFVGIRWYSNSE
jgi:hypothetical protein